MIEPDNLKSILDRIAAGTHTEADIAALRRTLLLSSDRNVVQLGKYNVNIDQGQDIQIGDRIYQGADAEGIRQVIEPIVQQLRGDLAEWKQNLLPRLQEQRAEPKESDSPFSEVLSQYLSQVAAVHAHLSFPFHNLSNPILLDEVYLDLPIVKPPTDEILIRPRRHDQRLSGDLISRIDELLKQNRRAALVSILGMGKTTTLRYLAWVYAQRPENRFYWRRRELVPFYARIRDLARLWTKEKRPQGPEGFVSALAETVSSLFGVFSERKVARVLQQALDNGYALILLDALDEFQVADKTQEESERNDFVNALDGIWKTSPFEDNLILLTSRPYRFLRPSGFGQYALQNLEPSGASKLVSRLGRALLQARHGLLSEEQIASWLRRLQAVILAPRLQDFRSPFYTTLMVSLGTGKAEEKESLALLADIQSLTDLYRRFLTETITWERRKGNDPGAENGKALYDVLGYTAYYTFVEPEKRFWLDEKVAGAIKASPQEVSQFLQFWLKTGLLVEDQNQQTIAFQHAGFQEFGVAYALADMWRHSKQGKVVEVRQRYEWDPAWETVWQLFMGLA